MMSVIFYPHYARLRFVMILSHSFDSGTVECGWETTDFTDLSDLTWGLAPYPRSRRDTSAPLVPLVNVSSNYDLGIFSPTVEY